MYIQSFTIQHPLAYQYFIYSHVTLFTLQLKKLKLRWLWSGRQLSSLPLVLMLLQLITGSSASQPQTGSFSSVKLGHSNTSSQRTLLSLKYLDFVHLCFVPRKLDFGIPKAFSFCLVFYGKQVWLLQQKPQHCLKVQNCVAWRICFGSLYFKQKRKRNCGWEGHYFKRNVYIGLEARRI